MGLFRELRSFEKARDNPYFSMSQDSEQDLPKPPVPNLAVTLERYLAGVQAVVGIQQYNQTKVLVDEFGKPGGEGESLQRHLEEYAETADNWVWPISKHFLYMLDKLHTPDGSSSIIDLFIRQCLERLHLPYTTSYIFQPRFKNNSVTGFWLDDMYLKNPLPLPVNSNPFFMFPKQSFKSSNDQFRKELPQDYASGHGKGIPLCMETYYKFFSAYRRPGLEKDEQIFTDPSRHFIIVICRNQLFALHFPSRDSIPKEEAISDKLRQIEKLSKQEPTQPSLGLLTTENRRDWAQTYQKLLECPLNKDSIQKIEECLYVVCLDDSLSPTKDGRKASLFLTLSMMATHLLHGSGSDHSSGNRWFDKFLQFVVTKDGVSGFVVEHSISEGITVLKFCEEFMDYIKRQQQQQHKQTTEDELVIEKLKWKISEPITTAIEKATKKINKLVNNLDLYVMNFTEYGKQFIKEQKISPDVYIQLSLQLTHYKVHRKLVSTYESAALRKFKLGRVDNIRSCTVEALNWVQAMCDVIQVEDNEKLELFKKAVEKQTKILVYTINGDGPDNHLLGLKEIAKIKGLPEPALFKDKSYKEYLNFRLSTSQLPTKSDVLVGYGAVVPSGYGCSYNPSDDHITFCITSFNSSEATSSDFFALSLEGSLLQMRELCIKTPPPEIHQETSVRSD